LTPCFFFFFLSLFQISAAAGNDFGNKIKAIQAAFARTIATGPAGLQSALSKLSCDKDMSSTDFYFAIADSWSMGIQYGAKTKMCGSFAAITEQSSDQEIMNVFAEWSNAYWGKDFCAGGFCKYILFIVSLSFITLSCKMILCSFIFCHGLIF